MLTLDKIYHAAFVPSVAGLIIGGEVVKDLVGFVPMKG